MVTCRQRNVVRRWARPGVAGGVLFAAAIASSAQLPAAKPAFAVAVIRPSASPIEFERNGRTEVNHGRLQMRDVTVSSCVQWAYGITEGMLVGPKTLRESRYDITAKADEANATEAQLRAMMQTLLQERFGLQFHPERRVMAVYRLTLAKGGPKLQPAPPEEAYSRENSATGTVARGMTTAQLADFLAEPLEAPVTDGTGLRGRYDFVLDFRPYVELERQAGDVKPDVLAVLRMALKGELGLELERGREEVEVTVVDRLEAPAAN